jgi:2-phosphoglycerate kinase
MSKVEVDHKSDLEAEGPDGAIHPNSTANKGVDRDNEITAEDYAFMREFEEAGRKKKVLRKMDLRILPVLILLYLVSFIGQSVLYQRHQHSMLTMLTIFRPEQHRKRPYSRTRERSRPDPSGI